MSGKLKGLNKVLNNLKRFGEEAEKSVEIITRETANDVSKDAKTLAPYDNGKLRQSINVTPIDKKTYVVGSTARYAPYQEFGTGAAVDLSYLIDAGLPSSYAAQFRGAGIRKLNLPAQPFLFPAFILGKQNYIEDLKDELKFLTKKYG